MKYLLWNLQDLFIFLDKYDQKTDLTSLSEAHWQQLSSSFEPNKPLDKIIAMRDLILQQDADICLFTEVGGAESLSNFNHYFLQDTYKMIHYKSNSDRGIDVAALVKPNLNITKHKMHLDKCFARGVLEIHIPGEQNLVILLTHLKSKLNKAGKDFEGRGQRQKEVKRLIDRAERLQERGFEVIITGDLNGVICEDQTEEELVDFAKILGLKDVLEYLQVPNFDRATYLYYNKAGDLVPMQLDYFLMSEKLSKKIVQPSRVISFLGGERTNIPLSIKDKNLHPSDHYPLVINLES